MRRYLLVFVFLTAVSLTGCDSGHTDRLSPDRVAAIKNGITTKEQVRAILGPPLSTKIQVPISQPAGVAPLAVKLIATEIWAFRSSGYKHFFFNLRFLPSGPKTSYTVIIYFDERGTVLDYETEQAQVY